METVDWRRARRCGLNSSFSSACDSNFSVSSLASKLKSPIAAVQLFALGGLSPGDPGGFACLNVPCACGTGGVPFPAGLCADFWRGLRCACCEGNIGTVAVLSFGGRGLIGTFGRKHSSGISSPSSSSHSISSSFAVFREAFDCQLPRLERGIPGKPGTAKCGESVGDLDRTMLRCSAERPLSDCTELFLRGAPGMLSPNPWTSPVGFRWCPKLFPLSFASACGLPFGAVKSRCLLIPFPMLLLLFPIPFNGLSLANGLLNCKSPTKSACSSATDLTSSSSPMSSKCAASATISLSSLW